MKPDVNSLSLLGVARSKAKMYEYGVPEESHIHIPRDPARLFTLAIAILGELAARINANENDEEYRIQLRKDLRFSAQFFDTYMQSKLDSEADSYLVLMGAAAYYLCDLPGSSTVLVNLIDEDDLDLDGLGLERLLLWLLKGDFSCKYEFAESPYEGFITEISQTIARYFDSGNGDEELFQYTRGLRDYIYNNGTPRHLLLADVVCAVIKQRYLNSTWYCLPRYSDITIDKWIDFIKKDSFIRELWPAQHLLGEYGIFKGKSAVVQMPTSAGKTKATEIIIRCAFLSERTSLAVIVAPFRALCHEIRDNLALAFEGEDIEINELSDVLQADFSNELSEQRQVIITTPEKLVYVIRHTPQLAEQIGLLVYDEGHQFDSGKRGVTYELLVTSLKAIASQDAQTVLVSAVISNAEAINSWLNSQGLVVPGTNLAPTHRTVAFSSWNTPLGRLEFVNQENPDQWEFFVPKIIEQYSLAQKPRERLKQVFPDRNDGRTVGLHLGLKLVQNGGVAIFCGTKTSATTLCQKVVDVYERNLPIPKPVTFCQEQEIAKLHFLYECNLGSEAYATRSAEFGVLAHHANIPHGIRLAVEHSLKEGQAKFVICTSTLAQGVNLPIRYLIVAGIYQGRERIRVRDFHNLIGRAGRAGLYTEGSILFADPSIYDRKNVRDENWRWKQVKELLNPRNSEPCISTLLSLFEPLTNDTQKRHLKMSPLYIAELYINDHAMLDNLPAQVVAKLPNKDYTITGLKAQIDWKVNIISAIESFLMAHWDDNGIGLQRDDIVNLAQGTLAFSLASEEEKQHLVELFLLLANHIEENVPDTQKRKAFGRTLYGVNESLLIEKWVCNNINKITACNNQEEILKILWPLLYDCMNNSTVKKCNPEDVLANIAIEWIKGEAYSRLLNILEDAGVRIGEGSRPRIPTIDHVVDICESGLAYEATLTVGAIVEFMTVSYPEYPEIIMEMLELQKRIKYGLPSQAITVCELGFSDRVIALELSKIILPKHRKPAIRSMKRHIEQVQEVLGKYPSYYSERLSLILRE